ncbi:hypothetical protein ACGF7W_35020 [Streptomyces sp. NPDC048219]|uniref:hypothetical protein n=1 Tax=Streptomyces sp. NPDC048219 TaxID=3365517 RepID=UPI00371E22CD
MHRSTPRPRPVPGAIVGYVNGRPVRVIAGGSGEDDPPNPPTPPAAPPAAPPAPTPKDVIDRQPGGNPGGSEEETVSFTQKRLNLMMTREKDQGRQSALRDLAAEAGLDPEAVDAEQIKQILADAKKAKEAQLSDEQKRQAEFAKREQAVTAKETAADQKLAAAEAKLQEAQRTATLMGLGASDADLEDALVLLDKELRDTPDADEATIKKAAKDLKKRRPGLFGVDEGGPKLTPPPAPGGSPAGGPPQRQTPVGKPGDAGRAMAARMFGTPDNKAA